MIVREIVPLDKRRSKVVMEDDFTLVLYRGELKRFDIEEGTIISADTYQKILNEVLLKRARERVLYLLKSSDKTELELRRKLKAGEYPEEAIDYAINFLKEHNFINDENYGRRYVEFNSERKSERQIRYELKNKGLDRELIQEILKEQPVNEEEQIRAYVRKKRLNPKTMDGKEHRKMVAAMGRKGFSYDVICRVLGNLQIDD